MNYNLKQDIERLLELFDLTIEEFAEATNVTRTTLYNILFKNEKPSLDVTERIYSFAYNRGFHLNKTKEMLFIDEAKGRKLLFHGAKQDIDGDIDVLHSKNQNDFGNGFYTGETLEQAASWVCRLDSSSVYCFYLSDISNLKVLNLTANRKWLYAILFYRNAFKGANVPNEVNSIVKEIESVDLIIVPIADNEMFRTIDSFARNEITDEACLHAVSATNLGTQYVLKNNKACRKLKPIEHLYLCKKEKRDFSTIKDQLSDEGINKSRLALVEYRRKGQYFDELFKR